MAFGRSSLYGRHRGRCHSAAARWSGDGYLLLYKRLSNGKFQWPRNEKELRKIDSRQFRWLMEGLSIEQPKAIQKGVQMDLF